MPQDDSDYRWRDLTPDYVEDVARFRCACPSSIPLTADETCNGLPLWQVEVEHIFSYLPWTYDKERDRIRVCTRTLNLLDFEVIGVYCVKIIDGTWADGNGHYHLVAYARSLPMKGTNFGISILRNIVSYIRRDADRTGRERTLTAYVDWRNAQSVNLLRTFGFTTDYDAALEDDKYRLFTYTF